VSQVEAVIDKKFKEDRVEWRLRASVDREGGFAERVLIEKISERHGKYYISMISVSHIEIENTLYFKITINEVTVLIPDLFEAPDFWYIDEIEEIETIEDLKEYVNEIVEFTRRCIEFY